MAKITVITPTVRPLGLKLVKQALAYQDFKDYEWIICSPKKLKDKIFEALDDFKFKFIGTPPLKEWQVWDLNYSYNRAIELSNGELIVSWQDFTFGDPDILSTLWRHYKEDPNCLVSVLGNKYPDDDFDIPSWIDPRYSLKGISWSDVEWNLCSCPKHLLYMVGGFYEGLDKYFGLDGFNVNHRLVDTKKVRFKLEKNVSTYSLFHDRDKDWDKKNAMGTGKGEPYEELIKELKDCGSWPILDNQHRNLK